MAQFIHLAPDKSIAAIRRNGLKAGRRAKGVYAVAVTPDFYRSHQWLRELRVHHPGPLHAIYFRLPRDTPVLYGTYRNGHVEGTADEAAGAFMRMQQPFGFETIVLASIPANAITSIKALRQVTGWRYSPTAKGLKPCCCPACLRRGEPFSQKIRKQFPYE